MKCAVAFWGNGAESLFGTANAQPRIFCDITMGGTSAGALRALGAPHNENLRHVRGLHSKVYLSERGAVIGSANASQNGIGLERPALLTESGVSIPANCDAFEDAAIWFETLLARSEPVDDAALKLAEKCFRPTRSALPRVLRNGSLLDLVAADPNRFSDIGFVFASTASTSEDRRGARQSLLASRPQDAKAISALPEHGMFIGWKERDLNRWPRTFIEFWMPGDNLRVFGRKVVYFDDTEGNVMTHRSWPAVRGCVTGEFPTAVKIGQVDGPMSKKIIEKNGNALYTSFELAEAIEAMSEQ